MSRILLLCFSILMAALPVNGKCSVTARCFLESGSIAGMPVELYRVGSIFDGDDGFRVDELYIGIQSPDVRDAVSLRDCAQALYSRALGSGYEPDFVCVARENGSVLFQDVPMGTYLMASDRWQEGDMVYRVIPVLVNVDGDTEIEIKVEMEPAVHDEEVDVSVFKAWVLSEGAVPVPVTVQLMRGGTPVDSVTLDDSNGWSYTWKDLDPGFVWTVAEASVPDGFVAGLSEDGRSFTITNTSITYLKVDPQTGFGLSQPTGLVLVILATLVAAAIIIIQSRKDGEHEKET